MPTGTKFNDAAGDEYQQWCQNSCDIEGPPGVIGRVNDKGEPFDVYYQLHPGCTPNWSCTQGLLKCFDCAKIESHVNG